MLSQTRRVRIRWAASGAMGVSGSKACRGKRDVHPDNTATIAKAAITRSDGGGGFAGVALSAMVMPEASAGPLDRHSHGRFTGPNPALGSHRDESAGCFSAFQEHHIPLPLRDH